MSMVVLGCVCGDPDCSGLECFVTTYNYDPDDFNFDDGGES